VDTEHEMMPIFFSLVVKLFRQCQAERKGRNLKERKKLQDKYLINIQLLLGHGGSQGDHPHWAKSNNTSELDTIS